MIQITTTHSSVEDALEFLHSYKARIALQSSFPPITGVSGSVSADEKAAVLSKTQTDAMDDTAGLEQTTKKPAAATARTERTASGAADAAQGKNATAGSTSTITPPADASDAKPVTYADLQAAVLKLHKADATAAKPIAEAMGFANFKAMPEDKWAEALAKVQEVLSAKGVV